MQTLSCRCGPCHTASGNRRQGEALGKDGEVPRSIPHTAPAQCTGPAHRLHQSSQRSRAKPRLVACCSIQLAQREGDAATLVAANENQVAEMAKLTALLRTIDSVCIASSMHLHSPLHSESQTLPSRAHAAVLFVSIRSTLLNDQCRSVGTGAKGCQRRTRKCHEREGRAGDILRRSTGEDPLISGFRAARY